MRNTIITKKCSLVVATAILSVGMLMGCGKTAQNENAAAEPVKEATETLTEEVSEKEEVAEAEEEESVTTPFLDDLEKYDSIISTLTTEQYYAFAEVGEDYDALLVADGVYDNGDGNMAAIQAKVYGFGNDGKIYEAGMVWSAGTAYPIAVYDKHLMFGGNHNMAMANVVDGSVIIQKEAFEVFDEQGNATYTYNNGNIDEEFEVEDDSVLAEMYDMYSKATVLNFFQGEVEASADMGEEFYPSNSFEERVRKISFKSYDEIIGLLEGDEAYALVNVMGYDGEVLLVTSYTYDDLLGHIATTELTPYTMKNGEVTADSMIFSGGTATPVAMDKDGAILTATHNSVDKYCYGDNGTDIRAIMVLATVYTEEFDDNGNPKSVGGFTRTNPTVLEEGAPINGDDVKAWKDMFEEYENAEPISFTRVSE